ncbi:MAG: hypothetical protein P8N09_02590 [Planctomycetota bacterium]|nr:hypothetical protein [Planctomycetota bacterium]
MTWTPRLSFAVGVLCLACAAWVAPGVKEGTPAPSPGEEALSEPFLEPVARALAPLGPFRAVASSVLWMMVQGRQQDGDAEAVADLAEGLLLLHPGLEEVRVFLARQLVVTQAPHSPDQARHRALVARGLSMLEEGFALSDAEDSERLHGALGTLLAIQKDADPRFSPVAAQYFGERPEDVAIAELRRARRSEVNALNLILLLVDRGLTTLRLDGDSLEANRDLEEATAVLQQFDEEERRAITPELEVLRQQLNLSAPEDERNRS